ncbi:MAG: NapC/NirT family cytochrome c [Polyangiaceae bacterium]
MTSISSPLAFVSLACAAISALLLIAYLIRSPPLIRSTKIWLVCALGVFPIGAAMSGNIEGYERTKARSFCASCHVMIAHTGDSDDPHSQTLSARHARNKLFGSENCYACHEDYGMFGTIATKMGGMKHVWLYYTEYHNTPIVEAKKTIRLYEPYPNDNCMQCHSTTGELWLKIPDHKAALTDVRAGNLSCASSGCHGRAHPYWPSDDLPSAAAQSVHGDAGSAPLDGGAL